MYRHNDYGYDFDFVLCEFPFQFSSTWSLFLFYFLGTDYTLAVFLPCHF